MCAGGVPFFLTVLTCSCAAPGGRSDAMARRGWGGARVCQRVGACRGWLALVPIGCLAARASGQRLVQWWGGAAAWGGRGTGQRCRCAPGATGLIMSAACARRSTAAPRARGHPPGGPALRFYCWQCPLRGLFHLLFVWWSGRLLARCKKKKKWGCAAHGLGKS